MKLLFLTPQLPWPPHQGTAIRNYNLIHHLARRHTVDLLTFLAPGEELEIDNPLLNKCRRVLTFPQPQRSTAVRLRDTFFSRQPDMALRLASPQMHEAVGAWLAEEEYDIVQSEGIEMARYGMQAAQISAEAGSRTAHVFDDHNCESLLQKRNAITDLRIPRRWPAAAYSLVQWRKLVRFERAAMRQARTTCAVSGADGAALQSLVPETHVVVAPNGVDLAYYAAHTSAAHTSAAHTSAAHTSAADPNAAGPNAAATHRKARLVFTGKMDYRPNIDAVLWFAREVLPRITAKRPDVQFQVVGRNPHARLKPLRADPHVEITGPVEDIRPWILSASAYVIPLRVGGGTRFKALEAMACAMPIVSTRLGVEGIGVEHGREMLLADSADTFADAVLTLIEPANQGLRDHLAGHAHDYVSAHFAWPPIIHSLESVYDQIVASARVSHT